MVDKYKARDYIAEKIGERYLIPLIGVWDDPDEIDFDALPNQMCIRDRYKCEYRKFRLTDSVERTEVQR